MAAEESHYLAFPPDPRVSISIGRPFAEACRHHVTHTYKADKIYIIVSKSISQTETFTALKDELSDKVVGIRYGMQQHVPWTDVLEVAKELRDTRSNLIVTLGAGSLTDGAKVASTDVCCFQRAVANSAFTLDDLAKLHGGAEPKPDPSRLIGCSIPIINIPTSLSGGEYTFTGGATDFRTHKKESFQHPTMHASLVILDPAITVSTPDSVWLSSGMRAVDHCIEGLCSVFFSGPADTADKTKVEETLVAALKLLLPNLLATKQQQRDLSTRQDCMLGVIEAVRGLKAGVPMGASHGIGHQLGPLGVGHGETSCVMLPSVLRYNARQGDEWVRERQAQVLAVFWQDKTVAEALEIRGHVRGDAGLGDAVAAFVTALGLPGALKEVGVKQEQFKGLAQNSMADRCIPTNPVTITQVEQVEEILQMAAGC